jgi:hypothetical protein
MSLVIAYILCYIIGTPWYLYVLIGILWGMKSVVTYGAHVTADRKLSNVQDKIEYIYKAEIDRIRSKQKDSH